MLPSLVREGLGMGAVIPRILAPQRLGAKILSSFARARYTRVSGSLVAPESVLVAPKTGLVATESVLVALETGLVAPKSIYIAPPLILVAPSLTINQLAVLIFGCTAKISILKQLMKPNGAIEKRPRAWDISERAAHEKKRPSREKKRAAFFHERPAFSAKQLVLLLRPISQFLNFSISQFPLGATKISLTRV